MLEGGLVTEAQHLISTREAILTSHFHKAVKHNYAGKGRLRPYTDAIFGWSFMLI